MNHQQQVVQRLIDLRKERGLSQKGVGELVGLSQQIVSKIEKLERQVDYEIIYNYAKAFNVSADWLLCISSDPTTDKNVQFISDYTGLSAKAIETIRNKCVPNEAVEIYYYIPKELEKDSEKILKARVNKTKIEYEFKKKIINDFIVSNFFENLIDCCIRIQAINKNLVSNLAVFCGDYDYFHKIQPTQMEYDSILDELFNFVSDNSDDTSLNDSINSTVYRLQKSFYKYFEGLSMLQKIDNCNIEFALSQMVEINNLAIEYAHEKECIECIQEYINQELPNQFLYDLNKEEFEKLKAMFDEVKKGGINGNYN